MGLAACTSLALAGLPFGRTVDCFGRPLRGPWAGSQASAGAFAAWERIAGLAALGRIAVVGRPVTVALVALT